MKWLKTAPIGEAARERTQKAIFFGLGIKSPEEYERMKEEKKVALRAELMELEK